MKQGSTNLILLPYTYGRRGPIPNGPNILCQLTNEFLRSIFQPFGNLLKKAYVNDTDLLKIDISLFEITLVIMATNQGKGHKTIGN